MIFVFFRITSFFLAANIFFPSGTPNLFKVAFSLFLSAIITITVDINFVVESLYTLISYGLTETITGLLLGYITSISFNSLKIGGKLIDQQLGLSMANIYDPQSGTQSTLIENVLYWMGILVFFQINGHHVFINGISKSFELIQIGESILENNVGYIINIFIEYFIIGLKIAVPILVALLIAELIMGLISRSVPQFNVMILGMPLKILVGTLFILAILPFILNEMKNLFDMLPNAMDGTFAVLVPPGVMLSTDKTEEATPKKKKDERKKGNVAKSKEVVNAITLGGVVLIFYSMSSYIVKELKILISSFLTIIITSDFTFELVQEALFDAGVSFAKIFIPIGIVILILGVIGHLLQTGLLLSSESLKPKLSKLNPINGFKNMFSLKALGNMVKSITIIVVLGYIGVSFMSDNIDMILKSGYIYFPNIIYYVIDIIKKLLGKILIAVIIIAILDFAYQLFTHKKQLKMTKQEIKEEYKQMEGDPQIKAKIKQKQRQMASQRMMQAVPSATVILTNPTHLSIAIRYEKGKDSAPIVVAKGADYVAMRIREIAKDNDIPIIENKPLARMIYKKVDIDREIPADMYQAVAEVLVAVYKIKNRYKKM